MNVINIDRIINGIEEDTDSIYNTKDIDKNKKNYVRFISYGLEKDTETFFNGIKNKLLKYNIYPIYENIEKFDEYYLYSIFDKNYLECINSILIGNPIPGWMMYKIATLLDYKKDIDCISFVNRGRIISSKNIDEIMPSTVASICKVIDELYKDLNGKHVTILNASENIGRLLSTSLINKRATVTVCNSNTNDIKKHTLEADIVVTAMGRKEILDNTYFKDGQVIIDAGIFVENGKVYHDTKLDSLTDLDISICRNIGKINTSILVKRIIRNL